MVRADIDLQHPDEWDLKSWEQVYIKGNICRLAFICITGGCLIFMYISNQTSSNSNSLKITAWVIMTMIMSILIQWGLFTIQALIQALEEWPIRKVRSIMES